ncbi:MAG: hypothetical protein J7K08_01445 [Thermoplasmata archaeon]|nr:hypothetical protein [Thermoplasmata archaeon]OYT48459.1 MAG: hypothetical protein B6U83_03455 [Thermoplasmatales archaeon ex4484_36]RLF56424.1 MAG: hypothetical protein DRN28_00415 [Thermoplasmata archaeon]RLF72053.1 MAG: hypothetical protein DRN35_01300 [Thermoplasmata archaeon]RLF74236.1 MAG: hypothetical protein DRN55_00845 [Thermoplasmata archaeon]
MKKIFRAYDIRGVYGSDLTAELMMRIGQAIGTYVKREMGGSRISVGADIRTTSELLKRALEVGLLSTGVSVVSQGITSFGVALFGGWKSRSTLSCYITASHLPPEWNGLKLYYEDGVGFPTEGIMTIRDMVLEGADFEHVTWMDVKPVEERHFLNLYTDFFRDSFQLDGDVSAAVDCGSGATSLSAPKVLSTIGVKLRKIHCEVDPFFSQRPSEPSPEVLGNLRSTVLKDSLDFGVAFDGDGDRAVVVDDEGAFLSTDTLAIILARDLLEEHGRGIILANVESSRAIEDVLEPLGAKVIRIPVGHTYLTQKAKELGAIFGVEKSGHMIMPQYFLFDDAMVIPARLAQLLSRGEEKLSQLSREIPQYPFRSIAVNCPDEIKFQVIERLKEKYLGKYERVNTMDGVRVDLEEGWVLIRASNTSPIIRLSAEARKQHVLKKLVKNFHEDLLKAIKKENDGG